MKVGSAPKREMMASLFSAPNALNRSVTGSFLRLSMLTDTISPEANEKSSQAPRSGINFAEQASWPAPSPLLK